jgi:hypothetical protein
MNQQAFAARSLTESIVAFAEFARDHGLGIGIQETAILGLPNLIEANRDQSEFLAIFCHFATRGRF